MCSLKYHTQTNKSPSWQTKDFTLLFKSSSLFLHFLKHFTQTQEKFKCLNFNSPLSGLDEHGAGGDQILFSVISWSKGCPQTIISSLKPKGILPRRKVGFLSSAAQFLVGLTAQDKGDNYHHTPDTGTTRTARSQQLREE